MVWVRWCVGMVVRFVCVIRVPVCARAPRVCPVSVPAPPVCLFTCSSPSRSFFTTEYRYLLLVGLVGVVSFLIAFTMSYRTCDLCAVQVSRVSSRRRAPLSQQRTLHPLALLVVVVNYLYVLLMIDGLPSTFQLYLLIGAVYWIGAAAGIWMLLSDENVERLPLIDSGSGGARGLNVT